MLFNKVNKSSAHQRNLQTTMIEIYKIIIKIAPLIMNLCFVKIWANLPQEYKSKDLQDKKNYCDFLI